MSASTSDTVISTKYCFCVLKWHNKCCSLNVRIQSMFNFIIVIFKSITVLNVCKVVNLYYIHYIYIYIYIMFYIVAVYLRRCR